MSYIAVPHFVRLRWCLVCLLLKGVKDSAELQSPASANVEVAACPASLRFMEPETPEATIIPACRARHGHQRALYTSTDSQLTIGTYTAIAKIYL